MTSPLVDRGRGGPGGGGAAVVIGAGVIGAAVGLALQRAGWSVTILDKGPAVGSGSTEASSSIVRFNYSTVAGTALAWEAYHRWVDWSGYLGDGVVEGPLCRYHRVGMVQLPAPGDDFSRYVELFDLVGVGYEVVPVADAELRFPALDLGRFHPPRLAGDPRFFDEASGSVASVLFQPDAGFVDDPQLAARNLASAAVAAGSVVRLGVEVTGVVVESGRVVAVEVDGVERLPARVVVNAAGPWSGVVNRLAGVEGASRISTRALRQTVAAAVAPDGFGVGDGGAVVADADLGAYCRPQPGGSFLVGGVEAGCDPLEWVEDPDGVSLRADAGMAETLLLRAARRIPALGVPRRAGGLAHLYDVSDDWLPIYDRSDVDGFFLAVGTSGNQFKTAPVVGEVLASLVGAVMVDGVDHDRDPVVVRLAVTGREVDLGQFSRNREPVATGNNVWG